MSSKHIAFKQRVKREAKIKENYDRISAALAAHDSKTNKNPTRIIPDVPGFCTLSKAEIKRDMRDIDTHSSTLFFGNKINDHPQQTNIESMNDLISCSTRPSCNPNTYLSNKKKRFEEWLQVPDTMHQELLHWKERAKASEMNYRSYIEAKESWFNSFDNSRKLLCDKLDNISRINKKMRMETKTLTSIVLQHASRNSKAKHHGIDHDGKNNDKKKNKKQVHSDHITDRQVVNDDNGCVTNDISLKRKSYLQLSDVIHDAFERRDSINNILSSCINEAKTTSGYDSNRGSSSSNRGSSSSSSSSSSREVKSKNKVIDDANGVIKKITKSKKSKNNHVVDKHANAKDHHHHRHQHQHHQHHVLTINEMDYYAIDFKYINPNYENNNAYTTTIAEKKMKTSDDKGDGGSGGGDNDDSNSIVLKDSGSEEVGREEAIRDTNRNNNINIKINSNDDIKANENANDNHDGNSDCRIDMSSSSSNQEVFTNDYICDHLQLQYFDAITKEVLPAMKPVNSSSSSSSRVMDDHHRSLQHDDTVVDDGHVHHAYSNHHKGSSSSKVIGITVVASDITDTIDNNNNNDDDNNRVVRITPQLCIDMFSNLNESMRSCESTLSDIDFMFHHDNRLLNDMILIESIVKNDKITSSSLHASTSTTATTTTTTSVSTDNTTNDTTVGDSNSTQNNNNNNYQANNNHNSSNNCGSVDLTRAPSLSLLPTKSEQQSIINIYSLLERKHSSNLNYWGKFLQHFFNSSINTVDHNSISITTRKKKRAINIELSQVTANARSRTPREVPLLISPLSQYEDRYIGNKNGIGNNIINNIINNNNKSTSRNVNTELNRCITQAENDCIQRCFLHTYSAMSDLKIRRLKVILKDSLKLIQDAMSSVKKMELMYAHALYDSSQENLRIQSDLVYYGIIRSKDEDNDDGNVHHHIDGSNNHHHHHVHVHSQDSVSATNAYPSTGSVMLEGMITTATATATTTTATATTHDQSTDDSKKRSLFQSSYGPFTKRRK